MTQVKVCGIKRAEHGLAALEAGANLLGFVFYPPSHRYVRPEEAGAIVRACRARFGGWQAVGVFVNVPPEEVNQTADLAGLDLVQLAGDEDDDYCRAVRRPVVKVVRVDQHGQPRGSVDPAAWSASRVLLDADRPGRYGGTGARFDWSAVRPFAAQAFLAGGLTPGNVGQALRQARPWGVDVSSGVERDREKDPLLIRQFLEEVRSHDGAR